MVRQTSGSKQFDDGDGMAAGGGQAAGNSEPVSYATSVQDSRAGERFHHVWAAIQSLKLLDERSRLREVWIEGAAGQPAPGDEIIDIAEYYGPSEDSIDEVVVRQLKYSTRRTTKPLGLTDLRDTLEKFAMVDARAEHVFHVPGTATSRYCVVTNRPIGQQLEDARKRIVDGATAKPGSTQDKLLTLFALDPAAAASLCERIEFHSESTGLRALRARLDQISVGLVPGADSGHAARLVEAVSSRTSGEATTGIRRADVGVAFGVAADELIPAPSLLRDATHPLSRACYSDIADRILASDRPLLITADGGTGKSIFAAQLSTLLADRADVVVYDCFGNGGYRDAKHFRHRHRDGLVQLSSELAALGLCSPLVPVRGTEPTEYLKAFEARLTEASHRLAEDAAGRHLVLLIDAADNAATAAESEPGDRTFVRDLLRLTPPTNVHIALTSRPYRVDKLTPPPATTQVELPAFTLDESTAMLRAKYPAATNSEALEFHQRTGGNPRTQALATADTPTLDGCLRLLAGVANSDGEALTQLLTRQLEDTLDHAGQDRPVLESISRLLATLRPRIPISVLALLTGGDPSLIRSFVSDLGRGLLVDEDAVQFLDEPTETFFRERYPLKAQSAAQAVEQLTRLAESNAYAAASLPQVLWEAGRYDELMAMAVSDRALPSSGEVERRQIAHLRASFALRAAFKLGRTASIVHLALLAGATAASADRRYTLLRDAADLTGEFLDSAVLDEIRAARLLPSEWPGAALSAEALMLAVRGDRGGEARSQLRSGLEAMHAWVRAPHERGSANLDAKQTARIALAITRLDGPAAGADYLEGWQPPRWVLETTGVTVATLLTRGEIADATAFGVASQSVAVSVGVAAEFQRLGLPMESEQTRQAWRRLQGEAVDFEVGDFDHQRVADAVHRGVAWIAAAAVRLGVASAGAAIELLTKYLPAHPPHGLGEIHGRQQAGLLHSYALCAQLDGRTVTLEDLLPPHPPEDKKGPRSSSETEGSQLTRVLPWLVHWARWSLDEATDADALALLVTYPTGRFDQRDLLLRRIAGPIAAQFARTTQSADVVAQFGQIVTTAPERSGTAIATQMVACLHGDDRFADAAYRCLSNAADIALKDEQSSDQIARDLIDIARAAYPFDREEARAYFSRSIDVVARVGEDAWDRWRALLAVAGTARLGNQPQDFSMATRIGRTGEKLQKYLYNGLDERELVQTIRYLTGAPTLALLSQWRDRRFGMFGYMLASLVEQPKDLFADAPHLAIALAPLSDRIRLGPLLSALNDRGELDDRRFRLARELEWARGDDLTANELGASLTARFDLAPHRVVISSEDTSATTSFEDDGTYKREQEASEQAIRKRLHQLDITTVNGMAAASEALSETSPSTGIGLLVDTLTSQPAHKWGAVTRAFGDSGAFTPWQHARFLKLAGDVASRSVAYRDALRDLAQTYLSTNATAIVADQAHGATLADLAGLLGTDSTGVLLRALAAADPANIVTSADDCYRLASTLATLMTPSEAVQALASALDSLDAALELAPWNEATVKLPAATDPTAATAAFLWTALADPRAEMRWRATHAVRFLLEYGDEAFTNALGEIAGSQAAPRGYTDERFPFYWMHAVEALLVAIERAAVSNPDAAAPLLPLVVQLRDAYPDHLRIQHICARIGAHTPSSDLWDARIQLRPADRVRWRDMPRAPKPHQKDAPTSEFHFYPDMDEYYLGPLSEAFGMDHAEVLTAASTVILDEWGWRGDAALNTDPRNEAGAYGDDQTYVYKGTRPKAESLDYYLTYHATLTVAGRLARQHSPLQHEEDEHSEFARWFADYDLARPDRMWVSDARRPTPSDLGHESPRDTGQWRWKVTADDFVRCFLGEDGRITVRQSARNASFGGRERISVSSALAYMRTAPALVRAMQTAESLHNHRLPFADYDNDIEAGPFRLRGWITDNSGEAGADRRDPFADDISYPPPLPTGWVRELLHLRQAPNGLDWMRGDGPEPVAVSEAWALRDSGRDGLGPDGVRLRVTPDLLTELATQTQCAVIVEVRIDRDVDSRRSYSSSSDDDLGFIDDYVRYFLFNPTDGWCDYLGRPVAR